VNWVSSAPGGAGLGALAAADPRLTDWHDEIRDDDDALDDSVAAAGRRHLA
jgi:hypothetical protein